MSFEYPPLGLLPLQLRFEDLRLDRGPARMTAKLLKTGFQHFGKLAGLVRDRQPTKPQGLFGDHISGMWELNRNLHRNADKKAEIPSTREM